MFEILSRLLYNAVSKPAARKHPIFKNRIKNGAECTVRINSENCNFCGVCSRKCIAHAITLNKINRIITVDQLSCIFCGLCEEDCPQKCIKLIS